jgi:hypothetical protein
VFPAASMAAGDAASPLWIQEAAMDWAEGFYSTTGRWWGAAESGITLIRLTVYRQT